MPSWLMADPDFGTLGPAARGLCLVRGSGIQDWEEGSVRGKVMTFCQEWLQGGWPWGNNRNASLLPQGRTLSQTSSHNMWAKCFLCLGSPICCSHSPIPTRSPLFFTTSHDSSVCLWVPPSFAVLVYFLKRTLEISDPGMARAWSRGQGMGLHGPMGKVEAELIYGPFWVGDSKLTSWRQNSEPCTVLNSAPEHGPSWGTDLYTAPGGRLLAPSLPPTLLCLPAAVGWGLTVSAHGQISASPPGDPCEWQSKKGTRYPVWANGTGGRAHRGVWTQTSERWSSTVKEVRALEEAGRTEWKQQEGRPYWNSCFLGMGSIDAFYCPNLFAWDVLSFTQKTSDLVPVYFHSTMRIMTVSRK